MIKGEWVLPTLNFMSAEISQIPEKRRRKLKKPNIANKVEELLRPTIEGLGYSIWDVENGIWINDCEKVHRAIDPILDEADPIEDAYRLNVSSKGLEPELRTEAHILACIGEYAEARLFAQKDGKKVYEGWIDGYENGVVTLVLEDESKVELSRAEISKLALIYVEEE